MPGEAGEKRQDIRAEGLEASDGLGQPVVQGMASTGVGEQQREWGALVLQGGGLEQQGMGVTVTTNDQPP